jgi:probable addiction module antidote protein
MKWLQKITYQFQSHKGSYFCSEWRATNRSAKNQLIPSPPFPRSCENEFLQTSQVSYSSLTLAPARFSIRYPGVLLNALGDVAKARGMAEVAKASGLGRESLYKTLAPGAKPRFETIATIMRALNVGFSVESRLPVRAKKARKLKAA